MSKEERDEFKKEIIKDFIKEWRPVVVSFFSISGLLITATWWFFTNVATVKDVNKVADKVDILTEKFTNDRVVHLSLKYGQDSLAQVTTNIQNSLKVGYVTSYRDKTGLHFKPYVN